MQAVQSLPGARTGHIHQVVVRRRTPEVTPQRLRQHLAPIVAIASHVAVAQVYLRLEAAARQRGKCLAALHTHFTVAQCAIVGSLAQRHHDVVTSTGVDRLHLFGGWMRCAVGGHDTVGAEIVIVLDAWQLAEVATGSPPAVIHKESLVNPIPDKATLQQRIFVYGVPVVLETTHAVAHGVAVFGDDVRALVAAIAGVGCELLHRWIHCAHYVRVPRLLGAFISHRPSIVFAFEETVGLLKTVAVAALVAETPHDDRRVVAVALVHVVYAVQYRVEPLFLPRQRTLAVTLRMAFHIGFVPHIDARRVAEVIP